MAQSKLAKATTEATGKKVTDEAILPMLYAQVVTKIICLTITPATISRLTVKIS